jgi:hypothetical protein
MIYALVELDIIGDRHILVLLVTRGLRSPKLLDEVEGMKIDSWVSPLVSPGYWFPVSSRRVDVQQVLDAGLVIPSITSTPFHLPPQLYTVSADRLSLKQIHASG